MLSLIVWYSKVVSLLKKRGRVVQDRVFALPAKLIHEFGVSPNFITVLSMVMVFVSSVLLFWHNKLYLLSLFLVVCLDMLDGTLARTYSWRKSGIEFDFFSDRFSDTMLVLAFMASGMVGYYFALLLLFFYVLSTLLLKLLEPMKVRIYLLSFRILLFAGLLLQEVYSNAFILFSGILLLDYLLIALFALPRIVFRK